MQLRYTTRHYTTLQYITLHYTTLHYITLHYTTLTTTTTTTTTMTTTTNYTALHCTTLHYKTLHYTTLRSTPPHSTPIHSTPLHSTTLHYTTPHHATPCHTTLHLQLQLQPQLRNFTQHGNRLNYPKLHSTTLITPPQMQLQLRYTNDTTPQLQLHYATTTTALHHTTSRSCGWGDRPGDHCNHCSHSKKTQLQPPFGPWVDSLCRPGFTTTSLSYRFSIFETCATALRGTTGISLKMIPLYPQWQPESGPICARFPGVLGREPGPEPGPKVSHGAEKLWDPCYNYNQL